MLVNIMAGTIPELDVEVEESEIRFEDGYVYVRDMPHRIMLLGDQRNRVMGLGRDDDNRLRLVLKGNDGEMFFWNWEDTILVPEVKVRA